MGLRKAWFTLVQVAYDLFLKLNPRKLAAHAVIRDQQGRVLLLRARFADAWLLPGGGLNRRENLDEAVVRECREELGVSIAVAAMTGFYFIDEIRTYVGVFRCHLVEPTIRLSHEHSEYRWANPDEVPDRLRQMVADACQAGDQPVCRTLR